MPTCPRETGRKTWYARCCGGANVMKILRPILGNRTPGAAAILALGALAATPAARADLAPVPRVLQTTCYTCHGANHQAEGSFDLNDSVETLISKGLVVPGDP